MTSVPTIWFDVEDLLHHFRSGMTRFSGIQRLAFEVYRAAENMEAGSGRVRFVRHGRDAEPRLVPVTWASLENRYRRSEAASVPSRRSAAAHTAEGGRPAGEAASGSAIVSEDVNARGGLPSAAATQARAIASLGEFGLALATHPAHKLAAAVGRAAARRAAAAALRSAVEEPGCSEPDFDGSAPISFEAEARPGDVLVALGSPWFMADYAKMVRWARDARRLRFVALMYDMVPANRPEWCHEGTVRTFRAWRDSVLPLSDLVLAISRNTAEEVRAWASRARIPLPGRVLPIPIGTGFSIDAKPAKPRPSGSAWPRNYVLFVSTLEARKNHALLVGVWRDLLDEERLGLRPTGSVPFLLFAGRVGWLVSDLLRQLENASWFDGRVQLIPDPTDAELAALYEGCLFSVFPSWHEGWGLPVSEALSLGVPVLCSSAGALPEAGGDLARYLDPGDAGAWRSAVAALIDSPGELASWRAKIRASFRPVPWSITAHAVLEAARSLA